MDGALAHNFIPMDSSRGPSSGRRTSMKKFKHGSLLKGSTHENAIVFAKPVRGRFNKSSRTASGTMGRMVKNFFRSMTPEMFAEEHSRDMIFSQAQGETVQERYMGLASVGCRMSGIQSFSVLWNTASERVTNMGDPAESLLDVIEFNFVRHFEYKNLTTVNVEVSFLDLHAKSDLGAGEDPVVLWEADLAAGYEGAGKYAASMPLSAGLDKTSAGLDTLSVEQWKVGSMGGRFHLAWAKSGGWHVAVLPPGGVVKKVMSWKGRMTRRAWDQFQLRNSSYMQGSPAFLFKAVGEEIYLNSAAVAATEDTVEAATADGTTPPQFTTAPVMLQETVHMKLNSRFVPGYVPKVRLLVTGLPATAGMSATIPRVPYAKATDYARLNGDGNGINGFGDIGNYTVPENAAAAKAGVGEGMQISGTE